MGAAGHPSTHQRGGFERHEGFLQGEKPQVLLGWQELTLNAGMSRGFSGV